MRRLFLALLCLAALPAQAAEVRPFVKGSWQELLAGHAGRPLVVHFWSLTCAPCLAELPRWGELKRTGFDLVLVSTDPIELAPRQQAVLARAGLSEVPQWSFADQFGERLRFEVDRRWRGELPMTRLVAADGGAETVTGDVDLDGWLGRQGGSHGGNNLNR